MFSAFGWGLVAGSAFVVGGIAALRFKPATRWVGLLTGFGAGALIAAVAYKLVSQAAQLSNGGGHVGIGLVIGSLLYLFLTGYWDAAEEEKVDVSFRSLVVIVVPEAVVIVGSLLTGHEIGSAVIAAVFLCGVPEAFVATHRLVEMGMSPRMIVTVWAGLALLCGLSAGVAYALLEDARQGVVALVLSMAGGAVLTELTTELVPESRALAGPLAGTAAVIGFAMVFALVEFA